MEFEDLERDTEIELRTCYQYFSFCMRLASHGATKHLETEECPQSVWRQFPLYERKTQVLNSPVE